MQPLTTFVTAVVFVTASASLQKKERKKVEEVSRHGAALSSPLFFLSSVTVVCCGGTGSFRGSQVCLSWLEELRRPLSDLSLYVRAGAELQN